MENLILLLLFTYPGAIMDEVYCAFSKRFDYYRKLDGAAQAARYFMYSAICTAISLSLIPLLASGLKNASLNTIFDSLKTIELLWKYLALSFAISILCGILFFCLRHFIYRPFRNLIMCKLLGYYEDTGTKDVWTTILNSPSDMKLRDQAAVILKGDRIVAAGLVYAFPLSPDEMQYSLMHCDHVNEKIQGKSNQELVSESTLTYYDAKNDMTILFIEASEIWERLEAIEKNSDAPEERTDIVTTQLAPETPPPPPPERKK